MKMLSFLSFQNDAFCKFRIETVQHAVAVELIFVGGHYKHFRSTFSKARKKQYYEGHAVRADVSFCSAG